MSLVVVKKRMVNACVDGEDDTINDDIRRMESTIITSVVMTIGSSDGTTNTLRMCLAT